MQEELKLYDEANSGKRKPKTLSLTEKGIAGIRVLQRHLEQMQARIGFNRKVGESEAVEFVINQYIEHMIKGEVNKLGE